MHHVILRDPTKSKLFIQTKDAPIVPEIIINEKEQKCFLSIHFCW
ncbi:unknown protein [Parachlamydia acanthamoebae UV-7]|uniref:Uncharacterized protein n=2 Tax=Parachlamydia acanthamoebae TaxID=83552 RepID=F8KXW9_PARAV|nr:hypothetical protein DB43_DT00050 [Parachlamydia acanthamoebae]CCB85699.1 unknown protein [Parachlamydia acanthamoebae UV-7]